MAFWVEQSELFELKVKRIKIFVAVVLTGIKLVSVALIKGWNLA